MNYGKRGVRKKQEQLNSKGLKIQKMFRVTAVKVLLVAAIAVVLAGLGVGFGAFEGIISSAPDISALDVVPTGYATIVYDSEGHEMAKLVSENANRSYVAMDKIPQDMADAFVAIEDERFYEHNGFDVRGIGRAFYENMKSGGLSQGASTITQQLLKNNVFDGWVTESDNMAKIKRKIQELYLAVQLEKQLSKEEILELYMNSINLGQNTLGVQAASLRYFGKNVYQLNLSECAVIAGITQNPTKYNPISHPDKNAERRERVLNNMKDQGYITKEEYDEAMADDVYERIKVVNEETVVDSVNTYFVDALTEQVADDLQEICGYDSQTAYRLLYSGGLKIYATQDPQIQSICDEVFSNSDNYPAGSKYLLNYKLTVEKANGELENHSSEMYESYYKNKVSGFDMLYSSEEAAYEAIENYKAAVMEEGDEVRAENVVLTIQPQVSLTVEDQSTGYVVAMVGGRGTKIASRTLNRATDAKRQPGSTFKVLSTYAPALDSAGMTLADVEVDEPYRYANGRPVNNWYGQSYKGICTLRYGIEQSLNIVTVKALTQIGPQLGYDYLMDFGFTTLVDQEVRADGTVLSDITQALALGGITYGVTNMELNAGYATIANNGVYIKPTLYTKIIDNDGNVIIDKTVPDSHRVLKETTAFLLTDAMVDVVTKGTGSSVRFDSSMAIAGKTGTTSDYNDVWFAGYTPYYTASVWTGFDNNAKLSGDQKNLSKKLWRAVMSKIHEDLPSKSFYKPADIVSYTVCSRSGRIPISGLCDATLRTEYFAKGSTPTHTCDVHFVGSVCGYTGQIACDNCPFKYEGVAELVPNRGGASSSGNKCPHNDQFFLDPNCYSTIQNQQWEIEERRRQAEQAAYEAAMAAEQNQ